MNFFQISETEERHGETYRATLFVDNDRKEAFLSFARNGVLFAVGYPVRYGAVWDQTRSRKALKSSKSGWGLMSRLIRAAVLERPLDIVDALEDFGLTILH